MITFVVPAWMIPDDTTVRKVTGETKYVLQRKVSIHRIGDTRTITTQGMVFLMGQRSISGYTEDTLLAVDVSDTGSRQFLDTLLESVESHK